MAPYGYRPGGEIDEDQAAVVLRIFQDFGDMRRRPALSEIAHDLNVDGVVTQRGRRWHASTIAYILRNQAYQDLVGSQLFERVQSRLQALPMGPAR
jgi:hypothetical protein